METLTPALVRRLLPTNKNRLDDELEAQAAVLERVSSQVIRASTAANNAKDALARTESLLLDGIMHDAANGGQKITVAQADGMVRRSPERMVAYRVWNDARAEHETWQGLYEAWRTKGFNIKALGELYAAQYFAITSVSVKPRTDYDGNRDRMRTARQVEEEPPRRERRRME